MFKDATWKIAYDFELTSFTQVNGTFTVNSLFALGSFWLVPNGLSNNSNWISVNITVKILSTTTFELSLSYSRYYQSVWKDNVTFTSKTFSLNERIELDFGFSKVDQFYWFVNRVLETKDLTYDNGEPIPTGYNTQTLYYQDHGNRPFESFIGPSDTRSIVGNNRTSEGQNDFKAGADMKVYSISIQ